MRPRLLDAFCGAGGASWGYYQAGFSVVGVDTAAQPNYPFPFHRVDALDFIAAHGHEFDAIHASPPCQFATAYRRRRGVAVDAVNLIPRTRAALRAANRPYMIENVEQARAHLIDPTMLCGSSFGLDVRRHRLFESNIDLTAPACDHGWQTPRFPPATNRTNSRCTVEIGVYRIPLAVQQRAMGIEWMNLGELSQAIPPAYTEYLGRQLIQTATESELEQGGAA